MFTETSLFKKILSTLFIGLFCQASSILHFEIIETDLDGKAIDLRSLKDSSQSEFRQAIYHLIGTSSDGRVIILQDERGESIIIPKTPTESGSISIEPNISFILNGDDIRAEKNDLGTTFSITESNQNFSIQKEFSPILKQFLEKKAKAIESDYTLLHKQYSQEERQFIDTQNNEFEKGRAKKESEQLAEIEEKAEKLTNLQAKYHQYTTLFQINPSKLIHYKEGSALIGTCKIPIGANQDKTIESAMVYWYLFSDRLSSFLKNDTLL